MSCSKELKSGMSEKMLDIRAVSRDKVVDRQDFLILAQSTGRKYATQ